MPNKNLSDYRKEIDEIDKKIVPLLVKRFEIVKEVGKIKKEKNLPIHNPSREIEVLDKVEELAGPIPSNKSAVKDTYKQIIKSSKKLEQ